MPNLGKIKLTNLKKGLKRLPRKLAENSFLTFLVLLFFLLILGGIIFYQFVISIKTVEISGKEPSLKFDTKGYQEILSEWQKQNQRFQEADTKEYPNPFRVD